MSEVQNNWLILKFGGSSVGEPAHWQTIANVVKQRIIQGYRPLLVLSALKNVSNLLEGLLHQALAGVHPIAINQLKDLHFGFASQLKIDANTILSPWLSQLEAVCRQVHTEQTITAENHAKILSFGELLSSTIGAAFLNTCEIATHWQDARKIMTASTQLDHWHHFTNAQCDFSYSPDLKTELENINQVIVTQGFIAADEKKQTVLLGREGSDTSAAYLGAKLNAAKIEIWTDVPGVFSTNPRDIPQARQLPNLSYQIAYTMAQLGSKVLHPRALEPAEKYAIPLQVKCTQLPDQNGTLISHNQLTNQEKSSSQSAQIIALALEPQITWIKLPLQLQDSMFKNFASQMSALGFDLVFQTTKTQHQHLFFKYKNSDKPQPKDEALMQLFSIENIQIRSEIALISLVNATPKKTDWNEIIHLCQSTLQDKLMEVFQADPNKYLSLAVHSNNSHHLCKKLHSQLLESKDCELFGKNWQYFQL